MKKLRKKLSFRLAIGAIAGLLVLLILINLVLLSSDDSGDSGGFSSEEFADETDVNNLSDNRLESASAEDYGESEELLNELPYSTDWFEARALYADKESKAHIYVKLISNDGKRLFNEWLEQYSYSEDEVEIFFYAQDHLDGTYGDPEDYDEPVIEEGPYGPSENF